MSSFERVLVGYDGSEYADDALVLGQMIARRADAELVLASVLPTPVEGGWIPSPAPEAFDEMIAEAKADLEAKAGPIGATAEVDDSSSVSYGLQTIGRRIGADLVVIGSSDKAEQGKTRAGNKARQLMSGAETAVAIAPSGFRDRPGLDRIGVGVDGSPESRLATEAAVDLTPDGATLKVIGVASGYGDEWGRWGTTYPLAEITEGTRKATAELLDQVAGETPGRIVAEKVQLEGAAATRLTESSAGLDLLCLGSRAYGPVRRVLLGSVSSDVVNQAACAVLVVPRSERDG